MAAYGFGSGVLYATRNDTTNQTPRRFGTLQDVQVDFSFDIKQLYGQYQFAEDVARGKGKIQCKAKFGRFSGLIYNDLFFGETSGATSSQIAYQEAKTIPTTPYQVTVTNTTGFVDKGVRFAATGIPLTLVASAPATGQYSVTAGGQYTFAAADTTLGVLIDYLYTSVSGAYSFTMTNHLLGFAPRFQADLNMQYNNKQFLLSLYSCISPKITVPTKQDDYMISEFDFEAFANAAGNVGLISVNDLT